MVACRISTAASAELIGLGAERLTCIIGNIVTLDGLAQFEANDVVVAVAASGGVLSFAAWMTTVLVLVRPPRFLGC